MIKLMCFMRLKPDIPREQAIEYYESNHVPLIRSVMPGIVEYRRNFLLDTKEKFDIVTELWFENQATFDHAMEVVFEPSMQERIAEDELNFLDRSVTWVSVAEEYGGPV